MASVTSRTMPSTRLCSMNPDITRTCARYTDWVSGSPPTLIVARGRSSR
jgi:hypothetical protein